MGRKEGKLGGEIGRLGGEELTLDLERDGDGEINREGRTNVGGKRR